MKNKVLQLMDWSNASAIGLILFMSVFFAAVAWVMRPGAKKIYKEVENLPLNDGEKL